MFVFVMLLFSSCKKDYTCICDDPRIDATGFVIHDTKRKAIKKCENTKNPYNESQCYIWQW